MPRLYYACTCTAFSVMHYILRHLHCIESCHWVMHWWWESLNISQIVSIIYKTLSIAGCVYIQNITPSCVLCPGEILSVACRHELPGNVQIILMENGESIGNNKNVSWNTSNEYFGVQNYFRKVTLDDNNMNLTCVCDIEEYKKNPNPASVTTFQVLGKWKQYWMYIMNIVGIVIQFSIYIMLIGRIDEPDLVSVSSLDNETLILSWDPPLYDRIPTGYIITVDDKPSQFTNVSSYQLSLLGYDLPGEDIYVSIKTVCGNLTSLSKIVKIPFGAVILSCYITNSYNIFMNCFLLSFLSSRPWKDNWYNQNGFNFFSNKSNYTTFYISAANDELWVNRFAYHKYALYIGLQWNLSY